MNKTIMREALCYLMQSIFYDWSRVTGLTSRRLYKEKAQKIYDEYFAITEKKSIAYISGVDVEKNEMLSMAELMELVM